MNQLINSQKHKYGSNNNQSSSGGSGLTGLASSLLSSGSHNSSSGGNSGSSGMSGLASSFFSSGSHNSNTGGGSSGSSGGTAGIVGALAGSLLGGGKKPNAQAPQNNYSGNTPQQQSSGGFLGGVFGGHSGSVCPFPLQDNLKKEIVKC